MEYLAAMNIILVLVVVKHLVINLDKAKLVILKQRMVLMVQKVMAVPEVAGTVDMHTRLETEIIQILAVVVDLGILDLE